MNTTDRTSKNKKIVKIIGIIVAVIIALLVIASVLGGGGDEDAGVSKATAQTACENLIREKSTDPGATKFSGVTETRFVEIKGGLQFVGWVDIPNGTGGHVRHDYTCSAERPAGSDTITTRFETTN